MKANLHLVMAKGEGEGYYCHVISTEYSELNPELSLFNQRLLIPWESIKTFHMSCHMDVYLPSSYTQGLQPTNRKSRKEGAENKDKEFYLD